MDQMISWVLSPLILISLGFSAFYSIKTRRSQEPGNRGLYQARTNIAMGAMLIFIAAVQLFLSGESTLRIVIGALFGVIGLFNVFAGLRNHGIYLAKTQSKDN
ncbi:YtpI family protein [Paenibacillus sp. CAU 1782]